MSYSVIRKYKSMFPMLLCKLLYTENNNQGEMLTKVECYSISLERREKISSLFTAYELICMTLFSYSYKKMHKSIGFEGRSFFVDLDTIILVKKD